MNATATEYTVPRRLTSRGNAKLDKCTQFGFLASGLTLAPHSIGKVGTVCQWATRGCKASCLAWFSGRNHTHSVRDALINRTRYLASDRPAFETQLNREIQAHIRAAHKAGLRAGFRLNVASDLDWSHIAAQHPDCLFWDYSKSLHRVLYSLGVVDFSNYGPWPANYHLTYSFSENATIDDARQVVAAGGRVAVVFDRIWDPRKADPYTPLPKTWRGMRVIDGDRHDIRLPVDPIAERNCIVGLRYKGSQQRMQSGIRSGFVVEA